MQNLDAEIEIAADWWAHELRCSPAVEVLDTRKIDDVAMWTNADLIARSIEEFRVILVALCRAEFDPHGVNRLASPRWALPSRDTPRSIIERAIMQSKINYAVFPPAIAMYVKSGEVNVYNERRPSLSRKILHPKKQPLDTAM